MKTRFFLLCGLICGGALFISFFSLFWFTSGAGAGSAISVPREARARIDEALAVLEGRRAKKREALDIAEAEAYVRTAEEEALQAEAQAAEAREAAELALQGAVDAVEERDKAALELEEAAAYADRLMTEATKAQLAASEYEKRAVAAEGTAYRRDLNAYRDEGEALVIPLPALHDELAERGLRESDELRVLEGELKEQELYQREKDIAGREPASAPRGVRRVEPADWGAVSRAYRRAEVLQKTANAAAKRAEAALRDADEKLAAAEAAAGKAEDALLALQDARQTLADSESYAADARGEAALAVQNRDSFLDSLANPRAVLGATLGAEFYSWDDGRERSGSQTVIPISIARWRPDFSWGLYTQYVMSDNLDTLTDTTLFLSKTVAGERASWEYSLSVNIPTGKSALGWQERYARMTEDLVPVEQFGKGWQFTPGISYTRRTSETDDWTIGTSYTYSLEYDPTSDIPGDDISPGGEWSQFLRYRRIGERWQFVGELLHTAYGSTSVGNGPSYSDNDSWEGRLSFNRVLDEDTNLMFYYWLQRQSPSGVPFETDSPLAHYAGTRWSRQLKDESKISVTADVMTTSGSRYLGMYSARDGRGNPRYGAEMVDGRTKYTLGVGYTRKAGASGNIAIGAEVFQMRDGRSSLGYPATTYNGVNGYVTFYKTF